MDEDILEAVAKAGKEVKFQEIDLSVLDAYRLSGARPYSDRRFQERTSKNMPGTSGTTESLEDCLSRLREDPAGLAHGEEATRLGAVLPILARVGWDRDNVREVIPEFQVSGGRVDYCLHADEKNNVFVEAKKLGEDLRRHEEQLLRYAFAGGVEIAVLTDGLCWWLYLPLLRCSWEERKFLAIDIQQQQIPAAAEHLRKFLGRGPIADGSAVAKAKELHASTEKERLIRQTMPRAWMELRQEPDEILVELLGDKVESMCGHRPALEPVQQFIIRDAQTHKHAAAVVPRTPKQVPSFRRASKPDADSWLNKQPIAYTFCGQRYEVSKFVEILSGLCQELSRRHSKKVFEERSLGTNWGDRGRKYFSKNRRDLIQPKLIPGHRRILYEQIERWRHS